MTENELYELNRLPEIDPDYESKRREPTRVMTKKAWFMSLFLPVLLMLASVTVMIVEPFFIITMVPLGLVFGGIIPTVMIARNKVDMSGFFRGKIILFGVLAVAAPLSWIFFDIWTREGIIILVLPLLIAAAELTYAGIQKTDIITKICLALSSFVWCYLGFVSMFVMLAANAW